MIKFIEDKEICIKLKEKGFDEGCIMTFRGEDIQALSQMGYELKYTKNSEIGDETNYWLAIPTYCQVVDWFSNTHKIIIEARPLNTLKWWDALIYNEKCERIYRDAGYKTYYEALKKAIEEALKLI